MKNIGILFILAIIVSCSQKLSVDEKTQRMYDEAKDFYAPEYVNFLPDLNSGRLLHLGVGMPAENIGRAPKYIHILMEYPKSKMDSIITKANSTSITYSFKDPNLLILDYDPSSINHFVNFNEDHDTIDLSPIPNFDFIQNNARNNNYIDKAVIYNLLWVNGPIMDEKYLRTDRAGLPEEWKHGYTGGVTIWDNYVAYWIDIW